jgi:hypothetical protein
MSKTVIISYIVMFVGSILWLYGYFTTGNASLIDWRAHTPWFIADFLPNKEAEIGMALVFAGMVPIYWLSRA